MGQRIVFTEQELELKKFKRTTFYQTVFYHKIQDVIIDRGVRKTKAAELLGDNYKHASSYFTTDQKSTVNELGKKYGRNKAKRSTGVSVYKGVLIRKTS